MGFSFVKNLFLTLFILGLIGCKSTYKTVAFDEKLVPRAPDYSSPESWAVFPGKFPKVIRDLKIPQNENNTDVFYIYPTLLTDKKTTDWNADIWSSFFRQRVFQTAIQYQASAWANFGNLYVPFYRQTHYRIFVEPHVDSGIKAWQIAYDDVKNAFAYFLKHHNKGKPIIIAAHSQGSMHAKRLINDFFDEKPLQDQLVVAYLIGVRVFPNEFKSIHPLNAADKVGGFVSWNSYKMNKLPKKYIEWYKGGVTTNPISWDSKVTSELADHKGMLNTDLKVYPKTLEVKVYDGILWSSIPKIPGRFLLSFIKNYHFADINLYWQDIQENAALRSRVWYQKNKDEK
ncbi:MAG: DUF3089 domain-containing protein [Bacteroidetes bacterium]|nr:DUF3089 domain-containing protein [Bacteroidota bacterium]